MLGVLLLLLLILAAINYYGDVGWTSQLSAKRLLILVMVLGFVWLSYFGPTLGDLRDHQYKVDREADLRRLYHDLRSVRSTLRLPQAGNLAECERMLAGCEARALRGEVIDQAQLPAPDEATLRQIQVIKDTASRSAEEAELLGHFYLLQDLRETLTREPPR